MFFNLRQADLDCCLQQQFYGASLRMAPSDVRLIMVRRLKVLPRVEGCHSLHPLFGDVTFALAPNVDLESFGILWKTRAG